MTKCARCRSENVFEMDLTVTDQPARFVYCRACEHRFWNDPVNSDEADRTLALTEVLAGSRA